jgi:myo-inositol 2-dehydrogenase/D-chiro-inositol 1-dehydrogenase
MGGLTMAGAGAGGDTLNVGLLGAGRIAAIHAETLASARGVGGVAIFDPVRPAADALASRMERGGRGPAVRVAGSVAELLEVADAVVVATPSSTHGDLVGRAAAAGLPVFCEKPIALDLDSVDAVLAGVAAAGVDLQVGFQRRFDPGYLAVREAITSGAIGRLLLLRATAFDHVPPPPGYLPTSGGIHADMLVHDFDAVRWLTGREVAQVYAAGAVLTDASFAEHGDVDTSVVVLTLDDGTMATLSASRRDPLGYDHRLEVLGTGDSLAVGLSARAPLRLVGAGGATQDGDRDGGDARAGAEPAYASFADRFRDAYRAEMEAFVALALGAGPNRCGGADARAAMVVALAAGRSMAERRPVAPHEVAVA